MVEGEISEVDTVSQNLDNQTKAICITTYHYTEKRLIVVFNLKHHLLSETRYIKHIFLD